MAIACDFKGVSGQCSLLWSVMLGKIFGNLHELSEKLIMFVAMG